MTAAPTHAAVTLASDTIRGIFFDLDDTLIGYAAAERSALAAGCALAAQVRPDIDEGRLAGAIYAAYTLRYEYGTPGYRKLGHLGVRELRRELTEEALRFLDVAPEVALTESLLDAYEAAESQALHAFPDAAATLSALRPHFTLGLITNGPAAMQRGKLAALALEGYFEEIIVDTEFGHPKPDTRIFAHAAARTGLNARQLLFVGNSLEADITGANYAGWTSVWIHPQGRGALPLTLQRDQQPDYIITCLADLLALTPITRAMGAGKPTQVGTSEPLAP